MVIIPVQNQDCRADSDLARIELFFRSNRISFSFFFYFFLQSGSTQRGGKYYNCEESFPCNSKRVEYYFHFTRIDLLLFFSFSFFFVLPRFSVLVLKVKFNLFTVPRRLFVPSTSFRSPFPSPRGKRGIPLRRTQKFFFPPKDLNCRLSATILLTSARLVRARRGCTSKQWRAIRLKGNRDSYPQTRRNSGGGENKVQVEGRRTSGRFRVRFNNRVRSGPSKFSDLTPTNATVVEC